MIFQSLSQLKVSPPTWVEIDLDAISHNYKEIKKLAARNKFILPSRAKGIKARMEKVQTLAVIKSDAYGHGMEEVALLLDKEGVNFFAVSDVNEGIRLRKIGIKKPILLFESTLPCYVQQIVDHRLMPTVCTLELAKELNTYAEKVKKRINIHIEIDTGMGRLGIWHKDVLPFVQAIDDLDYLTIQGLFTHFPAADTDRRFTQKQIKQLYDVVVSLDKKGLVIPYIHAANSMGLAGYQTKVLNVVRPGLMLYGLYPDVKAKKNIKLKPVMSVKSRILHLKYIEKGRSISYGRTFVAKKNMKIAILPIGYHDGYCRCFSNKVSVLINGVRCSVLGRVTMDQIMIDVTNVKRVKLGMIVTILGKEKKQEITADELAKYADTINYEIICSLGNQIQRVYKKKKSSRPSALDQLLKSFDSAVGV